MKNNKTEKNKCDYKCSMCKNYMKEHDFCTVKEIENCSKVAPTEFTICCDYLIRDDLIMF